MREGRAFGKYREGREEKGWPGWRRPVGPATPGSWGFALGDEDESRPRDEGRKEVSTRDGVNQNTIERTVALGLKIHLPSHPHKGLITGEDVLGFGGNE